MKRACGIAVMIGLLAGSAAADIASMLFSNRSSTAISHDRSIWVSATNAAEKLATMKWADSIIDRVEDMVDAPWRTSGHQLRIRITPSDSGPLRVQGSQRLSDGMLVQQLNMLGPGTPARKMKDEALCSLLLAAYVVDAREGNPRDPAYRKWVEGVAEGVVPQWFSRGVSQNLYAGRRAQNREILLDAWETGSLPLLAEFIRADGRPSSRRDWNEAYSGLVITRLIMLPGHPKRFKETFKWMADGKKLTPEWLVMTLPGCESLIDLDARWDQWMLAQRRRIVRPGGLAGRDIDRMLQELVVYPADFGVPRSSDWDHIVTFRQLIAHREAPWIPTFAAGRMLNIRTAALGKHKRVQPVVDRYCAFLDALGDRKREKKLNALLDDAESAWRDLLSAIGDPKVAPGDPELLPSGGP